jgi:ribonucleoside-diphosphate reductase alpha chain
MVNALLSRREPKTGPKGAIGWGADIDNPATGDNFHMFVKELRLPNGQIRPYSVWLSGKYPRVLEGLMKVLSIDLRISDPAWAAMKLRKLTTFGEVRGDFMAQIPGSQKQQNYPSTVAYMATLLLARMQALGLINDATRMTQAIEPAAILEASPVRLSGLQCPACKTMSWHRRSGCHVCDHCGHEGSCG